MYDHHLPYNPASAVVRHVKTLLPQVWADVSPSQIEIEFGPERQHIAAAESPELCSQVAVKVHRSKRHSSRSENHDGGRMRSAAYLRGVTAIADYMMPSVALDFGNRMGSWLSAKYVYDLQKLCAAVSTTYAVV